MEVDAKMSSSSYGQPPEHIEEVSYARNGSVMAQLFAKNRLHVAAGDHHNGEMEEDIDQNEAKEDVQLNANGDVSADGVGDADDDDDDDDDYLPDASSGEESDESDDEPLSDMDDEETSMRSLLLPMAKYAKQLLFLSDEEDDGEFEEQDARLWASAKEKRAWIDRYEAANRTYMDQYGCRIDAAAMPDVKKRLRRERRREAKYSLVFLALAVAYMIRLLVIGPTTVVFRPDEAHIVPAEDTTGTSVEPILAPTPTTAPRKDWTDNSPPWWTVWTEDFVVRVVSWPRSAFFDVKPALSTDTKPRGPVETARVAEESCDDGEPAEEDPSPPHTMIVIVETAPQQFEEDTEIEKVQPPQPTEEPGAESTSVPHDASEQPAETDEQRIEESEIASSEEVDTSRAESNDVQTAFGEDTVVESLGTTVDSVVVTETEVVVTTTTIEVITTESVAATQLGQDDAVNAETEPPSDVQTSLQGCSDAFFKLIKTKNDTTVRADAVTKCDRAVAEASDPTSFECIQVRVLRGDLRSLLYEFRDAEQDYEAALANAREPLGKLRSEILLKIASNRWIELYQNKQFRELRQECQRVVDGGSQAGEGVPDRALELATEWLRAFKREAKLLDVLTKTRSWTIYRPQLPQQFSD